MKKLIIVAALLLMGCVSNETQDNIARQNAAIEAQKAQQALQEQKDWHEQSLMTTQQISIFITIAEGIILLGIAFGIATLAIQGGYYLGQMIRTKSSLVYSGYDGQMPLVITRGLGYEIIRDPNLHVSATNALQLPSPKDKINLLLGKPVEFKLLAPPVENQNQQTKIATQAQAIRLVRASMSSTQDKVIQKQIRKNVEERVPEQLKAPMEDIITVEARNPREFKIVDQTGIQVL